jgi:hypothetical protein
VSEREIDSVGWIDLADDGIDVRAILARPDLVVPVTGAGVSKGAGFPDSAELANEMLAWPEAFALDATAPKPQDIRRMATLVAAEAGMGWDEIKQRLAQRITAITPSESATIRALVARGQPILTFNWDHAFELAATADGVACRTLVLSAETAQECIDALDTDGDALPIIHLHGSAEQPESMVLNDESYERLWDRKSVEGFFTVLRSTRHLCFMGTDLDELELLANLLHAGKPHIFVGDRETCRRVTEHRASLGHIRAIAVRAYDNADGQHAPLQALAELLSEPTARPPIPGEPHIPVSPVVDEIYVDPVLLITTDEDSDRALADAFLWEIGEGSALAPKDLAQAGTRTLVVGAPGSGKSTLLRRLGQEALEDVRPILIPLARVNPVGVPSKLLRDWASKGEGVRGEESISEEALKERSFHFLLDGLDEVPLDRQRALADKVVEVARAHPTHAFTIATRPIGALDAFGAPEWQRVSLYAGPDWQQRYLDARGTSWPTLEEAMPELADLRDLLGIPFFLSTVVDLHEKNLLGQTHGFWELVEHLVRQSISELPLDPGATLEWLRRLAMTMLLAQRTNVTLEEIAQVEMPEALQAAGEPRDVCDLLVSAHILMGRGDGHYSFIHRMVGESLASDFLVAFEPDEHGLIDVIAPCSGERLCGVRADWLVAVTLAGMRSSQWRAALRQRDALAAARTVPADAAAAERVDAARTIWSLYEKWRIWIWDWERPDLLEDALTLVRLLRTDGMEPLTAELRSALEHPSREVRGNAMHVLARLGDSSIERHLRLTLEAEGDSVLRRIAASSAEALGASGLFYLIAHRALHPEDEAESQDMTLIAAELAGGDELLELGLRLAVTPGTSPYLLSPAIAKLGKPRGELRFLRAWAEADVVAVRGYTERLLAVAAQVDPEDTDAAEDVGFVAAAWKITEPDLEPYVLAHPEPVLRGVLAAIEAGQVFITEVGPLLRWIPAESFEQVGTPSEISSFKVFLDGDGSS